MIFDKKTEVEIRQAVVIAEMLPEWFSPEAIKNIEIDITHNSLLIAKEADRSVGFLCYTTYSGKCMLLWMGVIPEKWGRGIGLALLEALEGRIKQLRLHAIEVETLPDEDDYAPYKQTRDFYYKNGFKRILYRRATIEGWDDQIVLEKKI